MNMENWVTVNQGLGQVSNLNVWFNMGMQTNNPLHQLQKRNNIEHVQPLPQHTFYVNTCS